MRNEENQEAGKGCTKRNYLQKVQWVAREAAYQCRVEEGENCGTCPEDCGVCGYCEVEEKWFGADNGFVK